MLSNRLTARAHYLSRQEQPEASHLSPLPPSSIQSCAAAVTATTTTTTTTVTTTPSTTNLLKHTNRRWRSAHAAFLRGPFILLAIRGTQDIGGCGSIFVLACYNVEISFSIIIARSRSGITFRSYTSLPRETVGNARRGRSIDPRVNAA